MRPQSLLPAPRRARWLGRGAALLGALGIALTSVVACADDHAESEVFSVLTSFTEALSGQDAYTAANLTDSPEAAAGILEDVFEGLGAESVEFVVQQMGNGAADTAAGTVAFTLGAEWNFGEGAFGARRWTTSTTGHAAQGAAGWKVTWDPALLVPGFADGASVRFLVTPPDPPSVLDRDGDVLMSQQTVNVVWLDPAQTGNTADAAQALAATLSPLVPTMTAQAVSETIASGQGQRVVVITLRDEDYQTVAGQLAAITGVSIGKEPRLLTSTKRLNSPVFNDLRSLWEAGQLDSAGWEVQLVTAAGEATVIAGEDGLPPPDVDTTLDRALQLAAQDALEPIPTAAVLVALEPSTGSVLAVAQNSAANSQGPLALTGLYPPGSTFKTVTVAAALEAGLVEPDDVVACPGRADLQGREIPNADGFDLGDVPLHTAFARSCNTTVARLALDLEDDALTEMAARFGLGVGFDVPGLTTLTGSVPPARSAAEMVEASIGQGRVTATPFGMAVVAATVADGDIPLPEFVFGEPADVAELPAPPDEDVLEALRAMMREVVTDGTAEQLADISDLIGKTGTAEYGNEGKAHGWFIAVRGDLAFAVFVEDGGSSAPAVEAAGRFLRAG